ncbi:hypothetical protein VN97_g7750 [Penicillium thymicola]|uniref:LysM domain-containing protein n=1 Tax=Penicillium thymicola TaxID=293382 RepID=A0AAI9TE68_PENTH|nr:hypothetical protein VN97_g7750 [Penicillium thymicola]
MGFFYLGNFIALIGILLVNPTATSGAAVAVAPQADSYGICYKYAVQAGETCSAIAQAHSITTANIETYNARSWAWPGCGQISQGSFICLSPGEPPMPVALPNAVCGPQVPGTARPNSWSDLGSLNPCAANECVSREFETLSLSSISNILTVLLVGSLWNHFGLLHFCGPCHYCIIYIHQHASSYIEKDYYIY